ncbi:aspartate/glutamate racemase family protein [Desulfobacula sp.]|uniref:aspartate/glutamate racemase family protein n=1 Tax=Desulfobacula sp. TaxID=2593537 RepID=UPI0025C155EF|nr:aspartate/glutamate racemase family protein [Desulfobacula sp.]MBC2705278.1 aspartate/glutamate racemase family protein [Desulfobacula sp.]
MTVLTVSRPKQAWYGESIGILILDASYPCIPGNVGNASTFPFPVRYEKVEGASIDRLLNQQDPELALPFIDAAQRLYNDGVRAITGACGFMALFQQEVAQSLDIPVFLSSLLQIPFIHQITGKKVGIITANATCLQPKHFTSTGINDDIPIVIAGMENQPEFRDAILYEKGSLDSRKIEQEVVTVVEILLKQNPDIGSILLECSDLPPYAHAIQAAVGIPVFDFITMINYVHTTLVRAPFSGFM